MDFTSIVAILTILTNVAVVISVAVLIFQLKEMHTTTLAQSYSVARGILQDEEIRQARKAIFELGRKGKKLEKWNKSDIKNAEMVCHTYDSVGQMVRNNLLKKKVVIDNWGPSLRRSWPILEPLVNKYRSEWDAPEVWDDFEWLADKAIKDNNKREGKRRV